MAPGSDKRRSIPTLYLPSLGRWRTAPRSQRDSSGSRKAQMSFEFPRADKPEDVGLSSPRLARIRDALQADIYAHLAGPLLKSHYEGAGVVDEKQTNAELVGKLGRLPLAYQPAPTWKSGVST